MTTTNIYYKNNYKELVEDMVYEFTENNPTSYEELSEDEMKEVLNELRVELTKKEFYQIYDLIEDILCERYLKEEEEKQKEWYRYLNTIDRADAEYLLYN